MKPARRHQPDVTVVEVEPWHAHASARRCGLSTSVVTTHHCVPSLRPIIASSPHRAIASLRRRSFTNLDDPSIPYIVKVNDLLWGLSLVMHMTRPTPIRFPVSTYSMSLQLLVAIGYWETGAITRARVLVWTYAAKAHLDDVQRFHTRFPALPPRRTLERHHLPCNRHVTAVQQAMRESARTPTPR